jgi:tRNA nucleotidyltransferase/poly(A) polymerase
VGTVRPFRHPAWLVCCASALYLVPLTAGQAQSPAIDELKGKIFDAHMAQQTFAGGLKFCDELNGKSFYFRLRNRILNLEEYLQSLENLAKAQVYNPDKRRPWSLQDAKERWEEVKKQAAEDKQKCELVQSLPVLEKQLQDLQKNATTSEKKE